MDRHSPLIFDLHLLTPSIFVSDKERGTHSRGRPIGLPPAAYF
jgi:hypothetical protein